MPLNIPTFLTRTGSAIVFAAIMLTGLLWNEWSFLALVCLIQVLCVPEYFNLVKRIWPDLNWPRLLPIVIQALSLILILIFRFSQFNFFEEFDIRWDYYLDKLLILIPIIILLISVLSKKEFLIAASLAIGGVFYITIPMIMLLTLWMNYFYLPICIIIMIWINDTMAYIVGSFIGKTPFSSISPKKTWEGTIGGAMLTIVCAAIWGYFSMHHSFPNSWTDRAFHSYKIIDWILLAFIVAVFGTLGDLLESKLKRLANVKDSGKLMPGHGGAMDRFDSLLVAIPFAFCYAIIFMPAFPTVYF